LSIPEILLGKHPTEIKAFQLIKRIPFPHDWAEQAKGWRTDAVLGAER